MGLLNGFLNKVKNEVSFKAGKMAGGIISDKIGDTASNVLTKKVSESKCPKCKKDITESGFKFCKDCGTKLTTTCPKCTIDYPASTKFCTQCGSTLE